MSYKGFEKFDMAIGTYSQYRGIRPDVRASHAIDAQTKSQINTPFKDLAYKYGYDLNRRKFPYTDRSFDLVLSYGAVGMNFGTPHTYQEMRRVLKPGGTVEIGVPGKEYARIVVDRLNSAGFRNPRTKTKTFADGGTMHVVTARKLDRSEK